MSDEDSKPADNVIGDNQSEGKFAPDEENVRCPILSPICDTIQSLDVATLPGYTYLTTHLQS